MSEGRKNDKREILQVFKDNELFWTDNQECGLDEDRLTIQIEEIVRIRVHTPSFIVFRNQVFVCLLVYEKLYMYKYGL